MKIHSRVVKQLWMELTDKDIQSMLKWLDEAMGRADDVADQIAELYQALIDLEDK